jgi:UDP-N-acetylenolpyruvoylglucosamine reductase
VAARWFSTLKRFFFSSRSGTTAEGSSHSEAGGGAVEAQVQVNKRGRKQSQAEQPALGSLFKQQQRKSTAAAAARAWGNEINTATR